MISEDYQVLIYWSDEDQAFIAEVPELPGAAAGGQTWFADASRPLGRKPTYF